MNLPRYVRWNGSLWRCSVVSALQVRLATIDPGQNQICLVGMNTFEALLSSGEMVEASRGWEQPP